MKVKTTDESMAAIWWSFRVMWATWRIERALAALPRDQECDQVRVRLKQALQAIVDLD